MKKILLPLSFLLVQSLAHADTLIVNNRSVDDGTSERICSKFPQPCRVLQVDTKDFGDKSIFVQFKESVVGDTVVVLAPENEKSDAFAEALVKVRTAHSLGAEKVSVFSEKPISDFGMKLMQVAGADSAIVVSPRSLPGQLYLSEYPLNYDLRHKSRLTKGNQQTYLFSLHPNSLAQRMAQNLGAKVVTDINELSQELRALGVNGSARVVVVSQWNTSEGNKKLIEELDIVERVKNSLIEFGTSKKQVILALPYLPYARGDKVDHPNTVVTGRLAADLIEAAGPDLVMFSRLHAGQSQGFFTAPTLHIPGRSTVNAKLRELGLDLVISPDAGFQKEATRYADDLGLPVVVLNKKRNKDGSTELKTMGAMNLRGKNVVIIDDETASGGTLAQAAQYLRSKGANSVYAVVTHLAGAADKAIQDPALDHIFVTSTMVSESSDSARLTILEIADEFSDALADFLLINKSCDDILKAK